MCRSRSLRLVNWTCEVKNEKKCKHKLCIYNVLYILSLTGVNVCLALVNVRVRVCAQQKNILKRFKLWCSELQCQPLEIHLWLWSSEEDTTPTGHVYYTRLEDFYCSVKTSWSISIIYKYTMYCTIHMQCQTSHQTNSASGRMAREQRRVMSHGWSRWSELLAPAVDMELIPLRVELSVNAIVYT